MNDTNSQDSQPADRQERIDELSDVIGSFQTEAAAALAADTPHSEAFYRNCDAERLIAELAQQYSEGDVVSYGDGEEMTGIVLEALTGTTEVPDGSGGETEVEASQDSPVYIVARGDRDGFDTFRASDLSSGTLDTDVDDPAQDASDTNAEASAGDGADLKWNYPSSWRKSSKPNRLILLDAWNGMGGSWRSCYPEYGGKDFCSDMKDRVWGTTKWRNRF